LESRFTFSFAGYHDPEHMGFGPLRVINEDWIRPGTGFGPHAHRDMEILTYVLEGRIEHRDSVGNHHVVGPNEIQTMSAGSGVVHSEANGSESEPLHLLQIWIEPSEDDLVPRYQQVAFDARDRRNRILELAGPGSGELLPPTIIHQDARVSVAELEPGFSMGLPLPNGRRGWVQVVRGAIRIGDIELESGDGAALEDQGTLTVSAPGPDSAEFLFFDLP
jgi:redox-sensitive bicupin YhaK (pirin superfamily)